MCPICSVRTSSHPLNTGNHLTSASLLCWGHMSVCMFLWHRFCVHVPESVFQKGGLQYSRTNQPTQPQSQGMLTRKVKQTQPLPFSQDASSHSYWLTHEEAFSFFHYSPTLHFSLRKLWRFGLCTLTPLGK